MHLFFDPKTNDLEKTYQPKEIEGAVYGFWLEEGSFGSEPVDGRGSFCVMMPPPNVTGILHIGHVLNNTVQDVFVRRARQEGKNVLWLPGTDHAGIATQVRVENDLQKRGLSRADLGREEFVKEACRWRDEHGGIILGQLKRLGVSCDWTRVVHTLDADYSRAVLTAFVELYKRGYIYRGQRFVNWCPVSKTALSDEEVTMKPQRGILYHIKYALVEEPGKFLEIATTRPETLMGDTAVAVNPNDDRYRHLIGKHCWRPFPRAAIPIIGDEAVERDFGTGVLKVTPAHDVNDFEIGKRHGLQIIEVLNSDGTLNALAGEEFVGMERFKARKVAAEKLRGMGLLVKEDPYEHAVGFSERADVPIEPRLSEQWFLKYPKVAEAKRVVENGMIRFWPEHWVKTYVHWLDNIRDWCISRQLWWGHQLPVWYRKGCDRRDPANVHVSVDGPPDAENWDRDEDVLDTWFSSWLWPMATLGWPDKTDMGKRHFSTYFPTDLLVTGPDILFFWTARMIMASFEFIGGEKPLSDKEMERSLPFKNVYLTGIIRDALGRKMSKSLGNSPDPIDLIETYGADGLRWGLLAIAPMGQDILFAEEKIVQGRNFCNKLWNACRYRQLLGQTTEYQSFDALMARLQSAELSIYERDILLQLAKLIDTCDHLLKEFELFKVIQAIETFFWSDFCDWYLEVSKALTKENTPCTTNEVQDDGQAREVKMPERIEIRDGIETDAQRTRRLKSVGSVNDLCLRQLLLLLHPIIPMITEVLWQKLGYSNGKTIQRVAIESGSTIRNRLGLNASDDTVERVASLREFVSKGRALKAQCCAAAKKGGVFLFQPKGDVESKLLASERVVLQSLLGVESIECIPSEDAPDLPAETTPLGILYFKSPVQASAIDQERLREELKSVERFIALNQQKLQSPQFAQKAPPQVIQGARKQLEENIMRRDEIKKILAGMG